MTTLFVTATGTGVGKTFVCCRLVEALRRTRPVRVLKPVASGIDPAAPDGSDTALLLAAQDRAVDSSSIAETTPWHFRAPLSPDMAAAKEGERIPFDALIDFCTDSDPRCLTIIEGVGGTMVPLDEQHTVLDWIRALDPAVWLVAGSYLGSISHTLTAIRSLASVGIVPAAIILSESEDPAAPLGELAAVLRRFVGAVPIAAIGRPPMSGQIAALADLATTLTDRDRN